MGSSEQTMLAVLGHWLDGREQPVEPDARRADVFDPAAGAAARPAALAGKAEVVGWPTGIRAGAEFVMPTMK